jgi:hypothetical protein
VLGVLVAGEAAAVDELGLEGRYAGFGHRVVVGVASRADGRGGTEPDRSAGTTSSTRCANLPSSVWLTVVTARAEQLNGGHKRTTVRVPTRPTKRPPRHYSTSLTSPRDQRPSTCRSDSCRTNKLPHRPERARDDFAQGRCVVCHGKISWPTRGANVDWTIGSTMRHRADPLCAARTKRFTASFAGAAQDETSSRTRAAGTL